MSTIEVMLRTAGFLLTAALFLAGLVSIMWALDTYAKDRNPMWSIPATAAMILSITLLAGQLHSCNAQRETLKMAKGIL